MPKVRTEGFSVIVIVFTAVADEKVGSALIRGVNSDPLIIHEVDLGSQDREFLILGIRQFG